MTKLTTEEIQRIVDGAPEGINLRHQNTNRNRTLNLAVCELSEIVNHHNPEVDVPISSGVWDCLDFATSEIEAPLLREILELRQEVERLKAQQSEVAVHGDDEAVHQFACAMKGKMEAARAKGREGWETCDPYSLVNQFVEHLTRCNDGNYLDLANYCMMLHQRGESPIKLAQMVSCMKDEVAARAVEKLKREVQRSIGNIDYAAFNLFENMNLDSKHGGRIVETTCPEKSLLIAIRDLKEATGAWR